jgi:ice-binding like protein
MFPYNRPIMQLAVLIALGSLSAACSDSPSGLTAPSFTTAVAGSDFVVLANAAVTCTDGNITGEVGTFLATPSGSVTQTTCPMTGTPHVGDSVATQAFNDFLGTYAMLAPKLGDVCTTLTGTLAGVTLAPGVYCFDAAATLTGVLTLNGPADGIWTFKIGTSGTGALTGSSFSVVMAGGGQQGNVTWWVAQGATMTDSRFIGTILGGAAITLTRGTFDGNLRAKADVTITGTAVSN